MRSIASAFGILIAAVSFGGSTRADTNYPWCAVYYNGDGVTTCSYETEEQCKLTVTGIGGHCTRNVAYNPSLPMDPMSTQQTAAPPPAPPPAAPIKPRR